MNTSFLFCVPPNPTVASLRMHAELNLFKLRTGRNIAGMKRQVDAYAAPTDTTSGMPAIGAGGSLQLPGAVTLQPSLYRYPVLIERAKQMVQLAAQVESAMLAAITDGVAERQTALQARQQLGLARAGVRLQDLRMDEANDGVTLADLQQQRAQIQVATYSDWLQQGVNEFEQQMIAAYQAAGAAQVGALQASRVIQIKQSAISAAQLAAQIANSGNPYAAIAGVGVGIADFGIDVGFFDKQNDDSRAAMQATAAAQIASVYANFDRRRDEWTLQKRLAEQDSLIGEQQKKIAGEHVQITAQERVIAGMQADDAKDMGEFLATKFTSAELFEWMAKALERVYRFLLQQATALVNLAVASLAFKNQQIPPTLVFADYWATPSDDGASGGASDSAPDRRGLTGSARLLQDIVQLDQYAFLSARRLLSLTKTFSLARMAPVEFAQFRETGTMSFATPMAGFDQKFPGHYLRLIKRVRVSVIALVPAIDGISATLSSTGPSRVVIGDDKFQTVTIRRSPESMALSVPTTSSSVVELESQPDMLVPFEGSGVDMIWEFSMPKAANRLDYDSVADVLLTIEHSALSDPDYRQKVIQSLPQNVVADQPFSLRNRYPDQWYDLLNPERSATPMTVQFDTVRSDFPLNCDSLRITQVLLHFARADGATFEIAVERLRYAASGETGSVGGGATSIDGIVSTRRGNAGSWTAMIGKSPVGTFDLSLPNTEEVRRWFASGAITDLLLVITHSGRTPAWPS